MMKRLALALLLLTFAPAQALKLTVWDRDLSSKVGAGESVGGKFNLQLVKGYSGPVIAIFSQSDDEKKNGQFNGLLNRYDGLLKNGQLTLLLASDENERSAPVPTAATSQPATPNAAGLSLGKLLQPYKLSVVLQPTGLTPLPIPAGSTPNGNLGASNSGTGGNPSGDHANPRALEVRNKK